MKNIILSLLFSTLSLSLLAQGPGQPGGGTGGQPGGGGGNQPGGGGSTGTFTFDTFLTDAATSGNAISYTNVWTGYTSGATAITLASTVKAILPGVMAGCTTVTTLNLSAATGLTEIPERAFAGCTALTSVVLPSTVTAIGAGAFEGCAKLASFTGAGVTTVDAAAFRGCKALASLPVDADTFGDFAFAQSGLTSADLEFATLGAGVCADCRSLASATAPDDLPDATFNGCTNLVFDPSACTSVGVAALAGVPYTAFTLPSDVSLAAYSFAADTATVATAVTYDSDTVPSVAATAYLGRAMVTNYTPVADEVCRIEAKALVDWLGTQTEVEDPATYSTADLETWLANPTNALAFAYATSYAADSAFQPLTVSGTTFVWNAPDSSSASALTVAMECCTNLAEAAWSSTIYQANTATTFTVPNASTAFARLTFTPAWQ